MKVTTHPSSCLNLQIVFDMNINVNRVIIDSRQVKDGDLFFGIKGQNYNGTKYSKQAIQNGAKLCITNFIPDNCLQERNKFFVVEDTYKEGLLKLAQYNRNVKYQNSLFIGVTGSVGKTTTKQMLKLVFERSLGNCYANPGNKNNHIGLPLSLCNIDKSELSCAIFEMGMSAFGQIKFLAKILKPKIGIITSIAPAHLQNFKSIDQIALAKAQIIEGIQQFLVLNYDSPSVQQIIAIAQKHKIKIITYSKSQIKQNFTGRITIKQTKIINKSNSLSTHVTLQYDFLGLGKQYIEYEIGGIGQDLIQNSCAVFGALLASKGNAVGIKYLQQFKPILGRGQFIHLQTINVILIDESYNSNPTSLKAALNRLGQLAKNIKDRNRQIAILGDMLELGGRQVQFHQNILEDINLNCIDRVYCVGKLMKYLFDKLNPSIKGYWTQKSEQMFAIISQQIQTHDIVMIKGSHSIRMNIIVQGIKGIKNTNCQFI